VFAHRTVDDIWSFTDDVQGRLCSWEIRSSIFMSDILYIGYSRAGSTYLAGYLNAHPDVAVERWNLANFSEPTKLKSSDKVHVCIDENITSSVASGRRTFLDNLYTLGAWEEIKDQVVISAPITAARLSRLYPHSKILIVIREPVDWLQSVYKYCMAELPALRRSFADFCSTPQGVAHLHAATQDRLIAAYRAEFGAPNVCVLRYEDIGPAFAETLCSFIGVPYRPLPWKVANPTNTTMAQLQRLFPFVEKMLPRVARRALLPVALALPGGRRPMLSSREIKMLRGIYALSQSIPCPDMESPSP